ncbi:MAG: ABC transporter ATP-binding protein [Nitrososphaerota archaeon]|nr:ABC transporter ATP-binding protein [Nitrososphaerota archaeon]
MEDVIDVSGLTKSFGSFRALDGFSLSVERGTIHGFLGPNGAGKTTTLKIIEGLMLPDAGRVSLFGHDSTGPGGGTSMRSRTGYMPQAPAFPSHMSALELMQFYAGFFTPRGEDRRAAIGWALDVAGIAERKNDRIGHYSGGMVQRLGLAQALLFRPELVILDEPSAGLDPAGMAEFRETIRRLRDKEGITVLLSSHLLHEVEQVSDRVTVIDRGKLVAAGTMAQIGSKLGTGGAVRVEVNGPLERVLDAVKKLTFVKSVEADGNKITIQLGTTEDVRSEVSRAIVAAGGVIESMKSGPTLEDLYMSLMLNKGKEGEGAS